MPNGILESLLGKTMATPSPSSFWAMDPRNEGAGSGSGSDNLVEIPAFKHYLATGQMPTDVPSPHTGVISRLLQHMGVMPSTVQLSPEQIDDLTLGKREYDEGQDDRKMKKEEFAQKQASEFGTESGSQLSTQLGIPEYGNTLPRGVQGRGQLQMGAQELKLQSMLNSQDNKEREMGMRELALQTRTALSEGNTALAERLQNLREGEFDRKQQEQESAPAKAYATHKATRINDEIMHLTETLHTKMLDNEGEALPDDHPRVAALRKEIDDLKTQRDAYEDSLLSDGDPRKAMGASKTAKPKAPTKPTSTGPKKLPWVK